MTYKSIRNQNSMISSLIKSTIRIVEDMIREMEN